MYRQTLSEIEAERYGLALGRLTEIAQGQAVFDRAAYDALFAEQAAHLIACEALRAGIAEADEAEPQGALRQIEQAELNALLAENRALYAPILPDAYEESACDPTYARTQFGACGQAVSFLCEELRGAVVFAYEDRPVDLLLLCELLLACHSACAGVWEDDPDAEPAEALAREIRSYVNDYLPQFVADRTREAVDPACAQAAAWICAADLSRPHYLFRFGEYITENEIRTAEYLAAQPQEAIDAMARTWTEGYRIGFAASGKDITKKKTVNIRYRLGFERVVRAAIGQFEAMGLAVTLYRHAAHIAVRSGIHRIGYEGAVPNEQHAYDHRNDSALYLDDAFVSRRLRALTEAYEAVRDLAAVHGGPAVMETFGEAPFSPVDNPDAPVLDAAQQALAARYQIEAAQITDRFIPGEERSFTIIAWPVPAIGEDFPEIFSATAKINNLDYRLYRDIQQKLIDALDCGERVRVRGMGGNRTDLVVALHPLTDPAKQTIFENCVADVNIPVGEVFTSPQLAGTEGTLHVSCVYLNGLRFDDLEIRIHDGMVADYACGNFADPGQGRRYIEENILYHHETLPVGEFAIGTNTTAYREARRFGIEGLLPILIAEKTGPHFAFGDTCYSHQEDVAVYNPDGKEIIARDNACSAKRESDPTEAYFGCHTDITIPYDELGEITVLCADGREIPLIRDGRFVLPGTEPLNAAFDAP